MKKFIAVLTFVSFFASVASAEEAQMSPLKKAEPAPYDGVLLTPQAVADIIADIATKNDEQQAAVKRAVGETEAQCRYHENEVRIKLEADNKIVQAQLEGRNRENKLLNESLKKAEDRQSNPALWAGVGVVLGAAATVLIVWAVNQK